MLTEEELLKINSERMEAFESWLIDNGVSETTRKRHLKDTNFFLNTYMAKHQVSGMENALEYLEDYFGEYFLIKCSWSSEKTIRSTSNSLKKFFTCMKEKGYMDAELCDKIVKELKIGTPYWQEGYRNSVREGII